MKRTNASNDQQLEPSNSFDLPEPNIPSLGTLAPTATQAPDTRPASSDILALIERNRIQSLKRKQRADSFLNKLSDDQLAKVLALFEDEPNLVVVHHHVTSPAPEGLGLQVDLSTLRRLRAHIAATHSHARTTEILDTLLEMENNGDLSQSDRILSAINQLLHQKAFELVRTEPGSEELRDLLATIERLSALELKRQKIALDREKMLRHHQRASNPAPPRKHQVELKIFPATTAVSANQAQGSDARQPVEIIAPLPEVIL